MRLSFTLALYMKVTSYPIMADNSTAETNTQDTFLREAESYMTYKLAKLLDNYWFPVLIPFGISWQHSIFLSDDEGNQ